MSTILNLSNKIRLENDIERLLLNAYSGAAAAYSLRKLDSTYSGDTVRVRRSSDNAEQNIGFVSNELDTATLETFVKSGNVFANPDITSASSWTIGNSTTYNAATEAFDLSSENGLTVRQGKSVANHTYTITIVLGSVTSGGIKIYAGGTQSAVISTAGTHTLNITAGSSNDILGINPNGTATCSISSFYAVDTTADGFVAIWYDQSGNAVNSAQVTATYQPKIVASGSTITNGGKPSILIDQTNTLGLNIPISSASNQDFFQVHKTNDDRFILLKDDNSGARYAYAAIDANTSTNLHASYGSPSLYVNSSIQSPADRDALNTLLSTNSQILMSSIGGDSSAWTGDVIWGYYSSANVYDGNVQEIIFYNTDQSTNRTGIETNINDHYSIY